MKTVIRAFFRTLRVIIGPFMLLGEFLSRPKGVVRSPARQAEVDQQCQSMALYQYRTCPFCIKVRQEMRHLSLNIALIDAQHPGEARDQLLEGGGQVKVPCLKIKDSNGNTQWLYESSAVIKYLQKRFATG